MEIAALRLFLDVARSLSFAAVAEAHGTNPSTVSRAIAALEADLGVRLFHRTTRRMVLTESGAAFRDRVEGALDVLEAAGDEARALNTEATGRVRLTASVAFGERVLLPLVPGFRAAHPLVELDLLLSDARLDLLGEGVDLAVRLGPALTGDFIARRLMPTRYRVCASPDYLRHAPALKRPGDLAAHACLRFTMPGFRSQWRFRSRNGREEAVEVGGDLAISSALGLRRAALDGLGPALLADWLVDADIAAGRLVDLFPRHAATATSFDTAAWLIYPDRAYLPRKARVMIDYLASAFRG